MTSFDSWDPLDNLQGDPELVVAAQKREISNILKSYTGYYDVLSEMLQNSLDAVEKRLARNEEGYNPKIYIKIDLQVNKVSVTDNGTGMKYQELRSFLRPNYSFKDSKLSRGNKGVGATYLGYGFNNLQVATKSDGFFASGVLARGRDWLEDREGNVPRPRIEQCSVDHQAFDGLDFGTSITIVLGGENTRPKDMNWIGAENAKDWIALLRTNTPIGGIYLCGDTPSDISIHLEVVSQKGDVTEETINTPQFLWPHQLAQQTIQLKEYSAWQKKSVENQKDVSIIPAKFKNLFGIWGEWAIEDIVDKKNYSPINLSLSKTEVELAKQLGVKIYIFLAYSTDLWDAITKRYNLRKGTRVLKGGLLLSTRNMPQGPLITIPMTNNIGFQNQALVVVHFEDAEPDLGRKGFQPETVSIAEKVAVSAVTAFRQRVHLLKTPGGGRVFVDELKIHNWIKNQEDHEKDYPLSIKGAGLFMPTEELPIKSEPIVEQDVVALFNQMLSSGLVRGIDIISSSQFNQYDGLYRISMIKPFDKFIYDEVANPMGVMKEHFDSGNDLISKVKVLEYKYSMNGLIEEFRNETKSVEDISLVIVWEIGEKWQEVFSCTSYLDDNNTHNRTIHGTTHAMSHSSSGKKAFDVVCLKDMISYLNDKNKEIENQRKLYGDL